MSDLLIIKPSSLGDIVHGLLIAQAIRNQQPETRITWVVRDRFAPLVRACPAVDDVLLYRRHGGPGAFLSLLGEIRGRRYDAVLDMQGLARSALMTRAARARRRIGRRDAREGARWFYGETVPLPAAGREAHAVDILRPFLGALGLDQDVPLRLAMDARPLGHLDPALEEAAPVVLCPHSREAEKEWQGFPDLARMLAAAFPHIPVVWDSDRRDGLAPTEGVVDLSGRTSLDDLIGLVQRARLVIANDSGPMHLAAALGRPVIGLFGPTGPDRFGPYPPDARGNVALRAPNGCLSELTTDTVAKAATSLLGGEEREPRAP